MSKAGQQSTKRAYEDAEIVEGFIKRNALVAKQSGQVKSFSKTITGKDVLDLGCGPGHDSYIFAELGFTVTGLDYSSEMIRRANTFKSVPHPPQFLVGDMRKLPDYFAENSFDAIWASASLLHIPPEDVSETIAGITSVARNNAVVYVGLKSGSGTVVVEEDKLGKPMQREFTLWTKESFVAQTEPFGWQLTDFSGRVGSWFRGEPTEWIYFFFRIEK